MSSLPPICHHVSWPVLKISLLITASASFFTPINGIFHIDLIIVWACHGQRISFPGSFSNAWSKKLHVHVNVWIKEHHLVFMPTSVTRWWTLWIIFGQIVLHCSNHLMNVNISIIANCSTLPHLILAKLKHTFWFIFLVMPLPVGTVLKLPMPGPVKVVKVFEAQTLRPL